jgi:pilus assembly protein CpaB
MKRLTPAAVTTTTVVVVGLLIASYFAKRILAQEQRAPAQKAQEQRAAPRVTPAAVPTPAAAAKMPPGEFREIPVALCPLQPGTELKAEYLSTRRLWVDALAPDTQLEERALIGRIVKDRIAPSAPIRAGQLYPPGERPPLPVRRNMRAVSVPLSQGSSTLTRFAKSGQFVDVHFTPKQGTSADGRARGGLTLTLFSGVRLLAVENESTTPNSPRSVMLEVTPEQANILILARDEGELVLTYNPDGQAIGGVVIENPDRATLAEIIGQKAPERPFTSESYKGSARSTRSFPGS